MGFCKKVKQAGLNNEFGTKLYLSKHCPPNWLVQLVDIASIHIR